MLPAARAAVPARAFAAIVTAVLLTAGCSTTPSVNRRPHLGSATASVVNGVQQITVRAGDTYRFDPSTIIVHPGTVRVVLVNEGTGAPHNWSLVGFPAAFAPLSVAGQSTSATFTAPAPGTYTFECTIHSRQGQTGKLVVVPG
jgi:plastocyanin